jgi:hypothetical protein
LEIIDALNLQTPQNCQKIVKEAIQNDRELFLKHAGELEEISPSKHSLVSKYHPSTADYVQKNTCFLPFSLRVIDNDDDFLRENGFFGKPSISNFKFERLVIDFSNICNSKRYSNKFHKIC